MARCWSAGKSVGQNTWGPTASSHDTCSSNPLQNWSPGLLCHKVVWIQSLINCPNPGAVDVQTLRLAINHGAAKKYSSWGRANEQKGVWVFSPYGHLRADGRQSLPSKTAFHQWFCSAQYKPTPSIWQTVPNGDVWNVNMSLYNAWLEMLNQNQVLFIPAYCK